MCARLLDPPEAASVRQAVNGLVNMEALDVDGGREELTPLGSHLACLPTDVRLGKFILLGAIFDCCDDALTIAATLSHRPPFVAPFEKRDAADAAKRSFAIGQSDHLACLVSWWRGLEPIACQVRCPPTPRSHGGDGTGGVQAL